MDTFLADADQLFEAARRAAEADARAEDWAVLLDSNGAVRIVEASGWRLDSLQTESGASTVYRIHRTGENVRVEGRSGCRVCAIELRKTSKPEALLAWNSSVSERMRREHAPLQAPTITAHPEVNASGTIRR